MKAELLEDVHETFLPKGTIGTILFQGEGIFCVPLFIPDNPCKDYGFDLINGAYIGNKKYKIIKEKKNGRTKKSY